LPARHHSALIVVGNPTTLDDAVRHGMTIGLAKPLDVGLLLTHMERVIASTR
jgi:hypothetical protein